MKSNNKKNMQEGVKFLLDERFHTTLQYLSSSSSCSLAFSSPEAKRAFEIEMQIDRDRLTRYGAMNGQIGYGYDYEEAGVTIPEEGAPIYRHELKWSL